MTVTNLTLEALRSPRTPANAGVLERLGRSGGARCLRIAALIAGATCVASHAAAQVAPTSQGLYAIPYEPGTTVTVWQDHLSHSPERNRVDLHAEGSGEHRVVAAASGWVRFIVDSNSATGSGTDNNYVWIEHPNGEWTKYSHMSQDSSRGDAGLTENEFVEVGQFLGIEDDVGRANGVHVHFEVAVPNNPADPIDDDGFIVGQNRVPRVCGIPNQRYVKNDQHVVPDVRPGWGEYARHGLPHSQYQAVFNAARDCDYQPEYIDGFERSGQAHFNVIFRPEQAGMSWASHRLLTQAQLDAHIDDYVDDRGYSLVHLDAYSVGTAVRYAAIFNRSASTPDTITYHGLSASAHQTQFDALTATGYRPRVISVASVNGTRTYAGVYTFGSIGSYQAKSFQTASEYQQNHTNNRNAGRRLIYLNSYLHDGAPRFTAIWAASAPEVFARHGMTSSEYQSHYDARLGAGWVTGGVTAYVLGGNTQYAAFWER